MSQSTDSPQAVQTRVAETLVALTAEDAPVARWTLDDGGAVVEGHLSADTDTDRRKGLAAWQRVIGAGPVEVRPHGSTEQLYIHGSYEGVQVRVVTIVAATPTCAACGSGDAA